MRFIITLFVVGSSIGAGSVITGHTSEYFFSPIVYQASAQMKIADVPDIASKDRVQHTPESIESETYETVETSSKEHTLEINPEEGVLLVRVVDNALATTTLSIDSFTWTTNMATSMPPGVHVVELNEHEEAAYDLGGDCGAWGMVIIRAGEEFVCTITGTDV